MDLRILQWCWVAANLGWVERKAATAFFGSMPNITLDDCEVHFRKAADLLHNYCPAYTRMGQCYAALKCNDLAREWLTKALDCPVKSKTEKSAHKDAEKALKNLPRG